MLESMKRWFGVVDATVIEIDNDAVWVDVRSESEFQASHLANAIHFPLEKLYAYWRELPADKQIVVYCRSGNRSSHARQFLLKQGRDRVVDAGGLQSAEKMLAGTGVAVRWVTREPSTQGEKKRTTLEALKILLPTDFSEQSDFARIMASRLADIYDVQIHYLHVIEAPDTVSLDGEGNIVSCGEVDMAYLEKQRTNAEDALRHLPSVGQHSASFHIAFGKLTDEITCFAHAQPFDLMIMGTKGAWGMKEFITGSQTQQIARHSTIPVLSLMCDRSDLVIQDVLYVHDFSKEESVPPLLSSMLAVTGARYHQLHIVRQDETIAGTDIESTMQQFAKKQGLPDANNHLQTADSVEKGVQQYLAENNADILFIGTHGRGGLFHESAAENLIKHLYKPIVLFHLMPPSHK